MKRLWTVAAVAAVLALAAGAQAAPKKGRKRAAKAAPAGAWSATPGLYGRIETSFGSIVVRLFEKEAPETVENFVGLATGGKEWTDPRSGDAVKKRFYDGLTFHRVVPGFVIQGGDPKGDSTGDPGYKFDDERNGLRFDKPGRLAMANSGPDTNGSQFFLTLAPLDFNDPAKADGRWFTVFGEVAEGQEVVKKISEVPADEERPKAPVVIEKLAILRVDAKGRRTELGPAPEPEARKEEAVAPAGPAKEKPAAKPAAKKKSRKARKKK